MNSIHKNINLNLSNIINEGGNILKKNDINTAEREAVWLMEFVLGKTISALNTKISEKQKIDFLQLINKRATHYPLQYLIGYVDFLDTVIHVTNNVLIPRPETEEMAEIACNLLTNCSNELCCADLGTGSGCIAIAIAKKIKNTTWSACDASESALEVAKSNAEKNSVSDKIKFFHGYWFNAFPKKNRFDFIISNPPYVEQEEILQQELDYEPPAALFSGKTGLDDYRIIISNLHERMTDNGVFMGEFGAGQSNALKKIAEENNFKKVEIIKDLSGRERFIIINI